MMTEEEHGQLKALAWRTLKAVDHIDAKAADEGLTIAPDWRTWRTQVRAVIRGDRLDIPAEPNRYAAGHSPTPIFQTSWDKLANTKLSDAPVFVDQQTCEPVDFQPVIDLRNAEIEALRARVAELEAEIAPAVIFDGEPPSEVLAEALPDEDYTALKQRLLVELGSLRNMLVGNIPMSAKEQAQKLARLAVLEHPKFQTWLQG